MKLPKLNIVAIVQARMGSTRLPGKIMLDVLGKPLLFRQLERISKAQLVDKIVVATSTQKEDDDIVEFCLKYGYTCFRGSLDDLLDRHYQAAVRYDADIILKIPSDCPLIDHRIIDLVIENYLNNIEKYDFVTNLKPGSWPDGNDVELMPIHTLEQAWIEAKSKTEREHTTPFIINPGNGFKIKNIVWQTGLDYSATHRWTIDYPEDYQFIRRVYEELYPTNPDFSLEDILNLILIKPDIQDINSRFAGQYWWNREMVDG